MCRLSKQKGNDCQVKLKSTIVLWIVDCDLQACLNGTPWLPVCAECRWTLPTDLRSRDSFDSSSLCLGNHMEGRKERKGCMTEQTSQTLSEIHIGRSRQKGTQPFGWSSICCARNVLWWQLKRVEKQSSATTGYWDGTSRQSKYEYWASPRQGSWRDQTSEQILHRTCDEQFLPESVPRKLKVRAQEGSFCFARSDEGRDQFSASEIWHGRGQWTFAHEDLSFNSENGHDRNICTCWSSLTQFPRFYSLLGYKLGHIVQQLQKIPIMTILRTREAVHRATASAKSPGCLLCWSLPFFLFVYIDGPCGPIVPAQH